VTVRQEPPARPAALSDLEKWAFPRWLDRDDATGGPSYLGYVMGLLVIALPLLLAGLAIAVIW